MYLLLPAVGDEGQAIGTYQHIDYMINKHIHKSNVYGREYDMTGIVAMKIRSKL